MKHALNKPSPRSRPMPPYSGQGQGEGCVMNRTQIINIARRFKFVTESNRIEGIHRPPTKAELDATATLLALPEVGVEDVRRFVAVCQPDARLRDRPGLNVRVGDHIAPPGGPKIKADLEALLSTIHVEDPWAVHVAYETLHPFTDGNGRSGRAIWAWQMVRLQDGLPLGFLHQWYYQTLSRSRSWLPRRITRSSAPDA